MISGNNGCHLRTGLSGANLSHSRNPSRLSRLRRRLAACAHGAPLAMAEGGRAVMTIKIIANDKGNPPGKLAEAELHFTDGPLEGLKLIGFSVWERKSGTGRNVTFPARSYSVQGERRSFALLRPTVDSTAQNRIRDLILEAYDEHAGAAVAATA
jgi:hypothetical protein